MWVDSGCQQFLQAVGDNLKGRFTDDDLVQMLQPLESTNWPEEEELKVQEMVKLAKLPSLPVNKAVDEFRLWKRTATAKGWTLNRILCAAKTYNCSSAECERGFSAANNTVTPMCNRLSAKSLASLLFIDLNGPPAANFKPKNYVESWVLQGHHLSGAAKRGSSPLASNEDHYGQSGIKFQLSNVCQECNIYLRVYELVNSTQL